MPRQPDYSDQRFASWFFWFYKKIRKELFPDSFLPGHTDLTEDQEQDIWDRVAFLAADRFPGEDEQRLRELLIHTRDRVRTVYAPFRVSSGRTIDEIRDAATRNPRIGNSRFRRPR